jgi:hypothetical protein
VELDELVGYHLEQAFGYRCELGPADDNARQRAAGAAGHLEVAGHRAMDRGDTAAAVNLLERAETLLPPRKMNLALQLSLTRGLAESGRIDDATARAARVAGQCSAVGDQVGELRARLEGIRWQANADPERWLAELDTLAGEARPAIEQDGDAAALAALEHAAGYLDYNRGRQAAALAAFTRGMQHARQAGDLWFETSMRAMAATCIYLGPTPISEALPWLDDARKQSNGYQPRLDIMKAALLAELGCFDEARSLLTETVAQVNERGLAMLAGYAMQAAWRIEMLAGDNAAAECVARLGCEQLDRLGERGYLSTQSCQLADALYALGRYDESEQSAHRGLELGSSDDLATQFLGLSVRSRLSARRGDVRAAFALAEQVDRLARVSDDPRDPADAALNRAEISYLAGQYSRVDEKIDEAIKHYDRKGATAYVARARRLAAEWTLAH